LPKPVTIASAFCTVVRGPIALDTRKVTPRPIAVPHSEVDLIGANADLSIDDVSHRLKDIPDMKFEGALGFCRSTDSPYLQLPSFREAQEVT
jgi:hypothetical protein